MVAQSNLSAQAKQLSDMTYWVQNLFSNTITESYSWQDTNNMSYFYISNELNCIIRLENAPIQKSLQETIIGESQIPQISYITPADYNLVFKGLHGFDTNHLNFTYHYVIDNRTTNFWKHVPQLNRDFVIGPDGKMYMIAIPH